MTAVLQVDQQPQARPDIRAPVGQRVRHLELLAEPVDELPQLLQRHIVLTPVGPQQAASTNSAHVTLREPVGSTRITGR